jgi:hypothetical protein
LSTLQQKAHCLGQKLFWDQNRGFLSSEEIVRHQLFQRDIAAAAKLYFLHKANH